MSILGLYLARRAGKASALVWLALGTLLGVFEFLEEAGNRALPEAALLALLGLPRLLMETAPFACAIGTAAAAALMDRRREIPAMLAAGLSPKKLAALCGAAALPFCLALLILGETALSPGERQARFLKDPVRAFGAAARDLWARDGENYVRIGVVGKNGDRLFDVAVYGARDSELHSVLTAKTATHADGEWTLHIARETTMGAEEIQRRNFDRRTWQTRLDPAALSALTVRPREMSLAELRRAVEETRGTGQNSADFAAKFWSRVGVLLGLPFLAACGIFFLGRGGTGGGGAGGRRAETAAVMGAAPALLFFGATAVAERLSALSGAPPLALLPALILGICVWLWAARMGEGG